MVFLKQITFPSAMKLFIDFLLLWALIYAIIALFRKNERAGQILKGLLIIVLARHIASWLGLKLVARLLAEFMNWGFLSIVIIFAPEIRNTLENVGKKTIFAKSFKLQSNEKDHLIEELIEAVKDFSQTSTGALITIEMNDSLKNFYSGGIEVDAIVSKVLLGSIFYPKSTLHDGAAIIQGNRISNAAVFFLPTVKQVQTQYGARHRAALGISEQCDCITIVVSEETGEISIARFGEIVKMSLTQLKQYLYDELLVEKGERKAKKTNFVLDYIEKNPAPVSKNKFEKEEILENGEIVKIYYRASGGNHEK